MPFFRVSNRRQGVQGVQGIRAVELFIAAGGTELRPIPCMNLQPEWVKTLVDWAEDETMYVSPRPGEKALSPATGV